MSGEDSGKGENVGVGGGLAGGKQLQRKLTMKMS